LQAAMKEGRIDANLLGQMSPLACAQGYSMTSKVRQLCNRWLIEVKGSNDTPAVPFVDPKTHTLIDVDFSN
jgi:hypothetical protein